jgi:hypothetical protein
MSQSAFGPIGQTQVLAASAANQVLPQLVNGNSVRVRNAGTADVYINFGSAAAVIPTVGVPALGIPVAAGSEEVFSCAPGAAINMIGTGATGNCFFTTGEGL